MISTADNGHHFDRAQDDKRTTPHIARAERKRRPLNSTAARRDRRRASFDLATRWPGRHGTVLHWRMRGLIEFIRSKYGGVLRSDGVRHRKLAHVLADACRFGSTRPLIALEGALLSIDADGFDANELLGEVRGKHAFTRAEAGSMVGLTWTDTRTIPLAASIGRPVGVSDDELKALQRQARAAASRAYRARKAAERQAEKRKAKAELVAEIMREHGVSERTAYRWIAEGRTGPRVRQQDAKPWVAAGCSESTWRRHGKPDSWRKIVKTAKTGVRRNKPNPLKVLGSCEVTENWQNAVTSKLSGKSLIPLSVTLAARAERATPPRINLGDRARPIRRRGRPRKALLRHRRIFSTAAAETVGVCGTKGPGRHAAPRWKVVIGFVPTVRISAEGQAR